MLAGGGGAATLLRPGGGAAELLPADGTRAVQLQPGHDAPRVEAVPALQQPHLLALRQVLTKVSMNNEVPSFLFSLINRGDNASYKIVFFMSQ